MNANIFIVTHKEFNAPKMENYIPIHVGKETSSLELNMLTDNTGDNISELNPYFNELTALYWMWKNTTADILGLVHYRRYFVDILKVSKHTSKIEYNMRIIPAKTFTEMIEKSPNTIFVHNPTIHQSLSQRDIYFKYHMEVDWLKLQDIILHKHRDYLDSFLHMSQSISISSRNMFVAHRSFVDKYCEWAFDILFELHKRIDYSDHDDYQKRAIGIIAERLFNVFIHKNRDMLDIKYLPCYHTELNQFD